MTKHFLDLRDYNKESLVGLVRRAIELKNGKKPKIKPGKILAMIFTKPSTRTNVSFHVAMQKLKGDALYLGSNALQLSRGETMGDTAKTLSRYVDAVMIRTFSHRDVLDLAAASSVPVINGLTDLLHPCQGLGDVMTITEHKGYDYDNIKVAFIGDGNNVCNSIINAAGIFGFKLTVASPKGFEPKKSILNLMQEKNKDINVTNDPTVAVKDADVIYTDVWVSMGDEEEEEQRREKFGRFQVNSTLLEKAKKDAIVMHCLPANRGEEVTDEVMDGPNSAIFDQAENRLHSQEAVLEYLLKK
ncbi:MAG: ornithine carbamoyltransferase [Elusimicrobia bacterium]|jgi:ornithine carbamoyltransferase|nr:ornithine carbamoyltransferase [Elusimicrobiota bacterium]